MPNVVAARDIIHSAWDHGTEPFGLAVTCSMDTEGQALVSQFGAVRHWQELSSEFLDQAPDGLASALSFFSDAARQYFIGGYLLADLAGRVKQSEPLFHLTQGFDDAAYGCESSPHPKSCARWVGLDDAKIAAIIAYLQIKLHDDICAPFASAALECYWLPTLRIVQ